MPRLMLMLITLMVVSVCEPVQSSDTQRCSAGSVGRYLGSGWVYELVNGSCSFSQAWSFCQKSFSSITALGLQEDEEGTKHLLTQTSLHRPVWVRTSARLTHTSPLTLSKHNVSFSVLVFSGLSLDSHARVVSSFKPVSAVSACLRVQFDQNHQQVSTLFSYASPLLTNEFQLRAQPDQTRTRVLLALILQGRHQAYRASLPNDARWHHVCVVWRRSDSYWGVYVDGQRADWNTDTGTARDMHGDGIFILGQDQDSFGGNFTEPFVGNITDVNVWDTTLDDQQVRRLEDCSGPVKPKPQLSWYQLNLNLHRVQQVTVMMQCPGLQEQMEREDCRVLDVWTEGRPQYNSALCTNTHAFICKTRTERYLKQKELEESLTAHPSPLMQHLTQQGVSAGEDWDSVSRVLSVCELYLRESREQLESRDLPSLLHLLSQAADLPSSANQSQARDLGHAFISLADSLISQENNQHWHNIKQVVSGPMVVVQSIDRMVSSISPLLLRDTDRVQIHTNNIRLQVQQSLIDRSEGSQFCSSDLTNQTDLDCISVPAQSMLDLHNNGFSKVTVLSSWYDSLTPLLNTEEEITLPPPITDSSLRYLGTVLGSSVISSTVMVDGQLISLPVNFHLQHRTQNTSATFYNPICAFWDFSLMPEDGGGWSTEGCEVISSLQDSTSCYCNHTTNFALLLQIYDVQWSEESERGLQILSFIGCGVSLCGLTFTYILFIAVGVPKSDRTTVHKNLIVALAVAQLLLIFSYWASANQEVCLLVTALLHLFFLSSFCWMLVEGLLLWSKVVSVNISEDRRMKFYYALGWGLPVLVVAVTLLVSLDRYRAEQHCWLNTEAHIIWAFVGPVLLVLTVNTVVLCRVIMVTVSSARRRAKMLAPSSASKPHPLDLTWAATRPVLILLPVLGLTWLCGVLVHLSVVLAYLFITLNAFQGLYIFLVYAVYNSEVQNAIKRIQEKRKALSFTNCSQPVSFLPSQKTPGALWVDSLPTHSSPENSSSGQLTTTTSSSLVFKNESFGSDSFVNFSFKPAAGNQVVQLMAFKPSAC